MLPTSNKNARMILAATCALVAAGMVTAAASQAVNPAGAFSGVSVEQTTRPVPTSPAAPTTSRPVVTTSKPAPSTTRPVPTTSKPAPSTTRPVPTTSKPAPKPTTSKPAPKPTTAKPTPAPVDQVPAFTEPSMTVGRFLKPNHGLKSKNKKYAAALQVDGNITVFEAATLKFVWGAGTNGKGGTLLQLQEDGNLVLKNAAGKVVWHTDTAIEKGGEKSVLTIEDDGDLVLYQGDKKEIAWHSDSAQD